MNKNLTTKEYLYAVSRAYGKTQVKAYKDAGYSLLSPQIMSVEASKIEHRPHVKEKIEFLRNEVKDEQKETYVWNRERATERLMSFIDRIESNEKLFNRHASTLLNCIVELNKIHKVQDNISEDKRVQIIIGRRDPDMPDDTADFID